MPQVPESKFTAWVKHPNEDVQDVKGANIPDADDLGIPLQRANRIYPGQPRNQIPKGYWGKGADKARARYQIQRYFGYVSPTATFFFGDEDDELTPDVHEYADMYSRWAATVKEYYPLARVSPGGFSCEPTHPYVTTFNTIRTAPVDEWRFNRLWQTPNEIEDWMASVDRCVNWCESQGMPLVIGSFGPNNKSEIFPEPQRLDTLKTVMAFLKARTRIVSASYWNYQGWVSYCPLSTWNPHAGKQCLTIDGEVFRDNL